MCSGCEKYRKRYRERERGRQRERERKRERERLRTSQSLGDVTQALNIWQTVHMGLNIA